MARSGMQHDGPPAVLPGGSSQQSPCHLPAATAGPALVPQCLPAGHWAGQGGRSQSRGDRYTGGRPWWAGGPFRARWMSGANEAGRQCHPEVTSGLASGHQELEPPHSGPPPIAPIRFLPIKQPVFLLSKPCQQWSLGKTWGLASGGRVSPQTRYEVNKCAHWAACDRWAGTGLCSQCAQGRASAQGGQTGTQFTGCQDSALRQVI